MRRIGFVLKVVIALWIFVIISIKGITQVVDVDSVGDIWVFAIDASGSMKQKTANSYRSPKEISNLIVRKLDKLSILDMPNYKQDHFFIYNTGIYNGKIFPNFLEKALNSNKQFVDLFAHSVVEDSLFASKNVLKNCLRKHLNNSIFPYKYSFVSQIRTSVLVKTILRMNVLGRSKDYRNIYIVTITDDGDINDQWRNDFKEMQRNSSEKLIEVNGMNSKFIYNPLTGEGGGELKELLTDYKYDNNYSENEPHIWLHKYVTKGYVTDSLNMNGDSCIVDMVARDGRSLYLSMNDSLYKEDPICFIYVDTVFVNGISFPVQKYMYGTDSVTSITYENELKKNEVSFNGYMQVKYYDSIYGPHYKKYPIKCNQVVFSDKMMTALISMWVIIGLIFIAIILYVFVVRPRMAMFAIYLSKGECGKKCIVRRGAKKSWGHGIVALLAADISSGKLIGFMFNSHRWIFCSNWGYDDSADDIKCMVIKSHTELSISSGNIRHLCTDSDIEQDFATHSGDCPTLLNEIYHKSIQHKLYEWSKKCHFVFVGKICRYLASHINKQHYYYLVYNDIAKNEKISIGSERQNGCVFLLEFIKQRTSKKNIIELECKVNDIVCGYYSSHKKKHSDALLRWEIVDNSLIWYLIQLEYDSISLHSLRQVRLLVYYKMQIVNGNAIKQYSRLVARQARKELRINNIDIGMYKECPNSKIFLDVSQSVYTSYISFVEDTEEKASQLLYSPISDGSVVGEKILNVKKMGNGHLYSSLLPFERCKSDCVYQKMDNNMTSIPQNSIEQVKISRSEIRFKTITIKLEENE